jgi:hypothetical protein
LADLADRCFADTITSCKMQPRLTIASDLTRSLKKVAAPREAPP